VLVHPYIFVGLLAFSVFAYCIPLYLYTFRTCILIGPFFIKKIAPKFVFLVTNFIFCINVKQTWLIKYSVKYVKEMFVFVFYKCVYTKIIKAGKIHD